MKNSLTKRKLETRLEVELEIKHFESLQDSLSPDEIKEESESVKRFLDDFESGNLFKKVIDC